MRTPPAALEYIEACGPVDELDDDNEDARLPAMAAEVVLELAARAGVGDDRRCSPACVLTEAAGGAGTAWCVLVEADMLVLVKLVEDEDDVSECCISDDCCVWWF